MSIQLDLLNPKSEFDIMNEKIKQIDESSHKVRKSLFAKHSELAKLYLDLHQKYEKLEATMYPKSNVEPVEFKLENTG